MNVQKNERRGAATLKTAELLRGYGFERIWQGWAREAVGIFSLYWRTGNQKDLCAFVRHVVAMRAHMWKAGWHEE